MEKKDVFKEREQAFEEAYFRAKDAKLVEKLRERATLGDVAAALKEKLQVDDPELLQEIAGLGITPGTGAALLLAPLVQVAWAEGRVTERERQTVIGLASSRGIQAGSPAHAKLLEWLKERPPDRLFDVAIAAIKAGLSVLTPAEREDRLRRIVDACNRVAQASGGLLEVLGMGGTNSGQEAELLDAIAGKLRAGDASR